MHAYVCICICARVYVRMYLNVYDISKSICLQMHVSLMHEYIYVCLYFKLVTNSLHFIDY